MIIISSSLFIELENVGEIDINYIKIELTETFTHQALPNPTPAQLYERDVYDKSFHALWLSDKKELETITMNDTSASSLSKRVSVMNCFIK